MQMSLLMKLLTGEKMRRFNWNEDCDSLGNEQQEFCIHLISFLFENKLDLKLDLKLKIKGKSLFVAENFASIRLLLRKKNLT